MSSFHVDGRISVKLEYELALRLGELIFASGTEDKQLRALGHKLLNIEEEENQTPPNKWIPRANPMNSSIVSEWQDNEGDQAVPVSNMRDKVIAKRTRTTHKWGLD